MEKPKFVYVTYINSTQEKVWEALTSTEASKLYWFKLGIVSDWQVGSPIEQPDTDGVPFWHGTVLESDPPKFLRYTFDNRRADSTDTEPASQVTYQLEMRGDAVKLTVTHDQFPSTGDLYDSISQGWPSVLSSLKSLLETGTGILPTKCDENAG